MISTQARSEFGEQLRRRRGRRKSDQVKVQTTVKISAPIYDALCRRASIERCSLHALMNRALSSAARIEFR